MLAEIASEKQTEKKIDLWEKVVNISIWRKSENQTKAYIDELYAFSKVEKSAYGMAYADLLYAKYFERKQEMEKAKNHADTAFLSFKKQKNELGMCKTLRQQGFNSFKMSNIEQAVKYAYQALAISVKIKNQVQEGVCMGQISILLLGTQPKEAIKMGLKGFNLLVKIDAKREASISGVTLSTLYLDNGDIAKSLHYIDTMFILQKELNDVGLIAEGKANAALIYLEIGETAKAEKMLEESGVYFSMMNSDVILAKFLRIKSVFYRDAERFQEAITAANAALEIIEDKEGLDYERGILQYTLFLSHKALKQYNLAMTAFERAVEHDFVLYDKQTRLNVAGMKEKYETDKKEQENKELKQQNEINRLKIKSTRYLLLGVIFCAMLVAALFYIILRTNKLKAREKNVQLQQRLLVSQMNPHFIFNSLNSIQNFIYKQDALTASTYLNRFAELMRMILNFSRKEQITLAEEVQMLTRYLEIQQLRFGEKLAWNIQVEEGIIEEQVLIPPMLAQPFIENALEHGLFKNTAQGNIQIQFKKHGDQMIFSIEDNGVGIEKNEQQEGTHTSLATQITKERMEAITALTKKTTTFEVTNLHDVDPSKHGVNVTFKIPYQTLF